MFQIISNQILKKNIFYQEKKGDDKNPKYSHDFKTLADVLIQETVRHDLGKKYPGLKDDIFGEESNKFTNTLGESVQVQVCDTQDDTSKLLRLVILLVFIMINLKRN